MDDRYFAGLFDGEGCITNNGRRNIRVQISMTNCALPLIMRIHNQYGGNLYNLNNSKYNPKWSDATWIMWSNVDDMRNVLSKIEPYLDLKREQVKLTLWWINNAVGWYGRAGTNEAKQILLKHLKLMKKSPYFPTEEIIQQIELCFNPKLRIVNNDHPT